MEQSYQEARRPALLVFLTFTYICSIALLASQSPGAQPANIIFVPVFDLVYPAWRDSTGIFFLWSISGTPGPAPTCGLS